MGRRRGEETSLALVVHGRGGDTELNNRRLAERTKRHMSIYQMRDPTSF